MEKNCLADPPPLKLNFLYHSTFRIWCFFPGTTGDPYHITPRATQVIMIGRVCLPPPPSKMVSLQQIIFTPILITFICLQMVYRRFGNISIQARCIEDTEITEYCLVLQQIIALHYITKDSIAEYCNIVNYRINCIVFM